jgi:hypothetical protein
MFEFALELRFTTPAIAFLLVYYSFFFLLVLPGLGHRGGKADVRVRARIRATPHQLAQQPRPYSPGAFN